MHQGGKRRRHRLATINCASLGPALEDEILSLAGGASLVHASRGTVLLDDIDSASPRFHRLLVPVLEDRALALPGREPVPLDLRVIATAGTSDALPRRCCIAWPACAWRSRRCARGEDIAPLFAHFAQEAADRARVAVPRLVPEVQQRLEQHDWPGNAHELARFAQQFVLGLVAPESLASAASTPPPLAERVDAFEREAIIAAVRAAQGRIAGAIAALGLPRKTFYYKVNKLGIDLQALRQE
ncbi:helix-turn-helix domain-containing protein [Novosphingobium pokkalii]|uniref:helix-turn-helix domain-containing protein n=1 Tax=Novosphingobium pokkalii TaxID=1770194 RepID=UPI003645A18A